ncbi:Mitochondrial glycine transporter [Chlorella vulgaris]
MAASVATQQAPARKSKSKVASAISGSVSGALVSACVQPLDVIRTRIQADMTHGVVRGTMQTMHVILAEGGIRTLWKGTQPTVIRLGLGAGLHFFFLETIKPMFEKRQPDGSMGMSAVGAMVTGGLSRTLAAVAACPFTIIKTRMEYSGAGGHAYTGTLQALSSIWRTEGVRGMYAGLAPTALSQAPFSALYYLFYTRLQDKLKVTELPNVGVNFVSGAVAAVAATVLTQPADVIRTRMQLNLAPAAAGAPAAAAALLPSTTLGIFRHIIAQHGMRGLLSGAAPRIVKRTLQTALLWTLYEELYPALTTAGEMMKAGLDGGKGTSSGNTGGSGGQPS